MNLQNLFASSSALQGLPARPAVRAQDRSGAAESAFRRLRSRLNAQDLLSTLLGMRFQPTPSTPRVRIRISVYAPDGRSAVDIRLGPGKA